MLNLHWRRIFVHAGSFSPTRPALALDAGLSIGIASLGAMACKNDATASFGALRMGISKRRFLKWRGLPCLRKYPIMKCLRSLA
jgi:hypothetical protein